jgi:hypothetical protein
VRHHRAGSRPLWCPLLLVQCLGEGGGVLGMVSLLKSAQCQGAGGGGGAGLLVGDGELADACPMPGGKRGAGLGWNWGRGLKLGIGVLALLWEPLGDCLAPLLSPFPLLAMLLVLAWAGRTCRLYCCRVRSRSCRYDCTVLSISYTYCLSPQDKHKSTHITHMFAVIVTYR